MPDRNFISRHQPFAKPPQLTRVDAAVSLQCGMTQVMRSRLGAGCIAAGMFVLWVVLGGRLDAASVVSGVAVAAALGIWASLVDL
jgi:hypothetical protein